MAGYQVDVQFNGFDQFADRLKNAPEVIAKTQLVMADRMVEIAKNRAVKEAPIDTGNLRKNLVANSKVVHAGGEFYGRVGTNLTNNGFPYPIAQEYGSGIYGEKGSPIVPKKGKFLAFKSKSGQWIRTKSIRGVRPKRFLKKGLEEVKSRINEVKKLGFDTIINGLSF